MSPATMDTVEAAFVLFCLVILASAVLGVVIGKAMAWGLNDRPLPPPSRDCQRNPWAVGQSVSGWRRHR